MGWLGLYLVIDFHLLLVYLQPLKLFHIFLFFFSSNASYLIDMPQGIFTGELKLKACWLFQVRHVSE